MEKLKKAIIKVALFMLFILIISATNTNSYAYLITNKAVTKEELNNDGLYFPDMLYRKQTAAYYTTIQQYNTAKNGGFMSEQMIRDWFYYYTADDYEIEYVTEIDNTDHNDWRNFDRVYEYFHPKQNSNYTKEGSGTKRWYSTGEIITTDEPEITTGMGKDYFTNIDYEYGQYVGLYNTNWSAATANDVSFNSNFYKNNNILIFPNNIYRYAIVGGDTLVSDNMITADVTSKLLNKYKDNLNDGSLTVYNSSVLRTSSDNGRTVLSEYGYSI